MGTSAGSMLGHLWLYEGSLEQGDNVLPLSTEGPAMAGEGSLARYCDVSRSSTKTTACSGR